MQSPPVRTTVLTAVSPRTRMITLQTVETAVRAAITVRAAATARLAEIRTAETAVRVMEAPPAETAARKTTVQTMEAAVQATEIPIVTVIVMNHLQETIRMVQGAAIRRTVFRTMTDT